ncbi:MAG: hypothetical protein ACKVX7_04445 [Planctomycetota bacterium]
MRRTLLLLVVGGALGAFLTSAKAQVVIRSILGVAYSHGVMERYEMSIGVDGLGRAVKERTREEIREHINIPSHYGRVISVTQNGDAAIVWFEGQGVIRNAVLSEVDTRLYRLELSPTSRYESRFIREDGK